MSAQEHQARPDAGPTSSSTTGSSLSRNEESGSPAGSESHAAAHDREADDVIATLSPEEYQRIEKSILWKTDLQVTLMAALLYLWSFLDRSNIGQAKLLGLQSQLGLSAYDYSLALTILYVPYIIFEIPSNLLLKLAGPARLIPTLVTGWGIVATLQGIVKTRTGLYINRAFLGLAEAGILPGIVVYFSFFYRPSEMQLRQSLNFAGASLAGSLGALLSAAISPLHAGGLQPWSWLFIIEGMATVVFGIASFWLLPNGPEKVRGLSEVERKVAVQRMKGEAATFAPAASKKGGSTQTQETGSAAATPTTEKVNGSRGADVSPSRPSLAGNPELAAQLKTFNKHDVLRTFTDPFVYLMGCMHFCAAVGVYSVAFFAPTIVRGLSLNNGQLTLAESLLLVTPPYALAFLVSIALALWADRYRWRGLSNGISLLVAMVGFAMAYGGTGKAGVQYAGLMLITAGDYSSPAATLSWISIGTASHYKRATSAALMIVFTNSGGIASTWLWNSSQRRGFLVNLILHIVGITLTVLTDLYVAYDRRVRRRDGNKYVRKLEEAKQRYPGATEGQLRELLGDQHPEFRLEL